MKNIVIAGYARTPFHFAHKGDLTRVRPDDLAAEAVKGLIERTGVDVEDIEDLILGCAFPEAEQGFNMARLVVFLAGLPISVAGTTINRFCGSSMQSIHNAAGAIQMGAGDVYICAGVESMSRVPMTGFNPMPHPTLSETVPGAYMSMGETAENVGREYNIDRAEQQDFAVASQQKAAQAQSEGKRRIDSSHKRLLVASGFDGKEPVEDCPKPRFSAGVSPQEPRFLRCMLLHTDDAEAVANLLVDVFV